MIPRSQRYIQTLAVRLVELELEPVVAELNFAQGVQVYPWQLDWYAHLLRPLCRPSPLQPHCHNRLEALALLAARHWLRGLRYHNHLLIAPTVRNFRLVQMHRRSPCSRRFWGWTGHFVSIRDHRYCSFRESYNFLQLCYTVFCVKIFVMLSAWEIALSLLVLSVSAR